MYLGKKRSILFLFCCFAVLAFKAQTLYWVGGSGNFNDQNHWSLTSGGLNANITSSANNDIVFDDNSGGSFIEVKITGSNKFNSLRAINISNRIHFTGEKASDTEIYGSLELSPACKWEYLGDVKFQSISTGVNFVNFGLYNISCNLSFGLGKYKINSVFQSAGVNTHFENGTYSFKKTSFSVSDLIVSGVNTSFIIDTTFFLVKNKLLILNNCSFITNKFSFYAPFSDRTKASFPAGMGFGNKTKLTDNSISAVCAASITIVPECSGSCTGKFSYTLDPSCSNAPYNMLVSNANPAVNCQNTANN